MCITAPGLVTAVGDGTAQVRIDGMTRTALTLLTPTSDPVTGCWWAGAVIRRIPRDEAESIGRALDAARPPDPSSNPQRGDPS